MRPVIEGLLAGWAIAVPVGAIGVLIVDRAATRGFAVGAGAAVGTALADFFYAVVAVGVGTAVAALLPSARLTQAVSAAVLTGVGLWMLRAAARPARPQTVAAPRRHPLAMAAIFFSLTVINPVTVVYFAALIAGLDTTILTGTADRIVFAIAAFVASLSWQLFLAAFGSVVGHRLSDRAGRWLRITGAVAVLAFAVRTGLRAIT